MTHCLIIIVSYHLIIGGKKMLVFLIGEFFTISSIFLLTHI